MISFQGNANGIVAPKSPYPPVITKSELERPNPIQNIQDDLWVSADSKQPEEPDSLGKLFGEFLVEIIEIPFKVFSYNLSVEADQTYKYTACDKKVVLLDMILNDASLKNNKFAKFMYKYYRATTHAQTDEDKRVIQKAKLKHFKTMLETMSDKELNQQIADFYNAIENYSYKNPKDKDIAKTIAVDLTKLMKEGK